MEAWPAWGRWLDFFLRIRVNRPGPPTCMLAQAVQLEAFGFQFPGGAVRNPGTRFEPLAVLRILQDDSVQVTDWIPGCIPPRNDREGRQVGVVGVMLKLEPLCSPNYRCSRSPGNLCGLPCSPLGVHHVRVHENRERVSGGAVCPEGPKGKVRAGCPHCSAAAGSVSP